PDPPGRYAAAPGDRHTARRRGAARADRRRGRPPVSRTRTRIRPADAGHAAWLPGGADLTGPRLVELSRLVGFAGLPRRTTDASRAPAGAESRPPAVRRCA